MVGPPSDVKSDGGLYLAGLKMPSHKEGVDQMGEHLLKNWIVYILLGGFVWFVVSVYIHSHREEKKRQEQDNPQEKADKK